MSLAKFIFIESNTSGTGELLLYKACEKNLVPIFITSNPKKYAFLPIENLTVLVLDTDDRNTLLNAILHIENVQGVYSSSDYFIETASWLAKKLKLLGTHFQTVKICRNKNQFYEAISMGEFNTPKTTCFSDEPAAIASAAFRFPIVIKPSNASGSVGVKLCQKEEDAKKHIQFLYENSNADVLIQEYVEGAEFSVEVCTFRGQNHVLGITKKYLSDFPYFIETGHDFPAILTKDDESNINEAVNRLLSFLNFDFGFCHIEVKIKEEKIVIIEVNPRLAGGMIPVLIQKATGLDVLGLLLDIYVGKTPMLKIQYNGFSSIRHVLGKKQGKINMLIYHGQNVDEIKFVKKPGEDFILHGDFRDRLAYLICSHKNFDVCKNKANDAIKDFVVHIEN